MTRTIYVTLDLSVADDADPAVVADELADFLFDAELPDSIQSIDGVDWRRS
jgi:hypothetical protein